MKKMLLMLIISITVFAWRAPEYLEMAGLIKPDPATQQARAQEIAAKMRADAAKLPKVKPMTMEEYTKLQKTDPQAYQKYIASHQAPVDKGAADKLVNFFKTGKYE